MESSAVNAGQVAPSPPRGWGFDSRWVGIVVVTDLVAIGLAYMVINVPLVGPKLTREESLRHWPVAVIGAVVVVLGVLWVVRETLRARRADPSPELAAPETALELAARPRVPAALRFQRVPGRAVGIATALSVATVPVSVALGASFPLAWFAFLAPWVPLVVVEARFKRTRDALFTAFGLLVLLQILHEVEHSVQVGQLLATEGDIRQSHGIFGQLDFELVHFVTDTTLWVSLGLLLIVLKGRNRWLWVAFAAASLHQVEHFYLFWLNHADNNLYLSGGAAGIMGKHGLIGSPLDRPYLHYTYNFIVLVPMLIAIWDEGRRVDRLFPKPS